MAEVFRAVARGTQGFQRILVVKRILPDLSQDPRFVQMFIDEAKICALISHPNVVQVYEFGRLGDTHFLTMEYVHGRNLSAVMEKLASDNKLPPPDVICEVVRQTCLGLHHAHTMTGGDGKPLAIIHRDVTPANLMVGFNGAVKVLDFGIARAAEEVKETKTQAGAVKGKVAYLAPEQINRRPIDHRIDLFAMGVVLHECLTGQRLFKADNPLAAMKAILDMPIPPPSSINAAVPKRIDQIVARALARDPNMRYQNGKAMALDLESALHELRYFSQRLPNFLRDLFKDEMADSKDRLLPKELSAISAVLAQSDAAVVAPVHAGNTSSHALPALHLGSNLPTEDIVVDSANPLARAWRLVVASPKNMIIAGVSVGALLALSLLGLSGGKPEATQAQEVQVATPGPATTPESVAQTVKISVDSFPQGAQIIGPEDTFLGTTPQTLSLERTSDAFDLRLQLEGYKSAAVTVIPDINKPVFAKLQAASVSRAKVGARAAPKRRRQAMPLDPFAD